jgi:hypothetical protein
MSPDDTQAARAAGDQAKPRTVEAAALVAGYRLVVERVDSLVGSLAGEEQAQARRVGAVAGELMQREREASGKLVAAADDFELRKELARLVEFLSRRSAKAIPSATLGRATLADLSLDLNGLRQACRECDEKLFTFGL